MMLTRRSNISSALMLARSPHLLARSKALERELVSIHPEPALNHNSGHSAYTSQPICAAETSEGGLVWSDWQPIYLRPHRPPSSCALLLPGAAPLPEHGVLARQFRSSANAQRSTSRPIPSIPAHFLFHGDIWVVEQFAERNTLATTCVAGPRENIRMSA